MEKKLADKFAEEWIAAWNSHDIEQIMTHYDEQIEFHSPFIQLLKFNDTGTITSKQQLRAYFEIGLKAYPDLHFKFHHCFIGINTLVLYYTSVNHQLAAEVFELNESGKAIKVYCNYTNA